MIFNGYEVCLISHYGIYPHDTNAIKSGISDDTYTYMLGVIVDYDWNYKKNMHGFDVMQTFSEHKKVVKMLYKNSKGIFIKLKSGRKYIDINIDEVLEYIESEKVK